SVIGEFTMDLRRLLLVLMLTSLTTATMPSRLLRAEQPRPIQDTFPSGGKPIRIERYHPATPGKHPAVLLLHGLEGSEAKHYRTIAQVLLQKGYVVVLVHYLDR